MAVPAAGALSFALTTWVVSAAAGSEAPGGGDAVAGPAPAVTAAMPEPGEDPDLPTTAATAGGTISGIAPPELLIPVAGVELADLRDSFWHAREPDEPDGPEKRHFSIDIFAPEGSDVLAATDGWIWRMQTGERGGISLYLLEASGTYLLYYAHLERYADGLVEGMPVRAGDVIGHVGRTGNVVGGAHLHLTVTWVRDPERWWEGVPVNPYPLLQ